MTGINTMIWLYSNTTQAIIQYSDAHQLFHGRIPINPIDHCFNNKTLPNYSSKFDYVSDLQTKLNNIFATTKEILVASFNR